MLKRYVIEDGNLVTKENSSIAELIKEIDAVCGEGYALANPFVLGAAIQAQALEEVGKQLLFVQNDLSSIENQLDRKL